MPGRVHMGEEDTRGRLWPKCGAVERRPLITTPQIPIMADCPDCLAEVKKELNAKYGKTGGRA